MAIGFVPSDVDPDEAAAAMAAVMMSLQEEAELEGSDGEGRWVLAGRVEAQGIPLLSDSVRRWRRR